MMIKNRIFDYISEYGMIRDGDAVVAGVSGGADSVCLLTLLAEYQKGHPFTLIAAHVHHGLRENADGDEAYVKELCERLHVPLKILHIDAKSEAERLGVSVEEAGRIKRYEFFREISKGGKIAVAHHRDDLCETMLFQMFRGSGISGLRGILPVSGEIIRPLLSLSREEIEAYLKEEGISWRTDESNEELIFARNRIRHEILPVAEEICAGAKEHMAESAARLREIEEYIKAQAEIEKNKYLVYFPGKNEFGEDKEKAEAYGQVADTADSILLKNEITELPKALSGELILQALCEVAGKKRDIGLVQVNAVYDLFSSQVGRKREFIYGLKAEREYEGVRLFQSSGVTEEGKAESKQDDKTDSKQEGQLEGLQDGIQDGIQETVQVVLNGDEFSLGGEYFVNARLLSGVSLKKIPTDSYTKWLNYDTINNCLVFRHPEKNDYLIINKEGGRKLLKDYFVNEKIPAKKRPALWVLADGDRILWVVGYRIGEDAKVTETTRTAIEIKVKEDPFYGRAH